MVSIDSVEGGILNLRRRSDCCIVLCSDMIAS